jgi:hypothetical protein
MPNDGKVLYSYNVELDLLFKKVISREITDCPNTQVLSKELKIIGK